MPDSFPNKGNIVIGHDVWLRYGLTIMPGVRIGAGAIVASQAGVTREVPPYGLVGGNPAKLNRLRFSEATIERLLKIRWWDWDIDKTTRNLTAICGGDMALLERAE